MTPEELRAIIVEELDNIAPESGAAEVPGNADLREALDIDSMDVLNFVAALHKRLGVAIPERDQPRLLTIDGAVAYLRDSLPARTAQ